MLGLRVIWPNTLHTCIWSGLLDGPDLPQGEVTSSVSFKPDRSSDSADGCRNERLSGLGGTQDVSMPTFVPRAWAAVMHARRKPGKPTIKQSTEKERELNVC